MSHRSLGVWASVAIALLVLVLDSQHGFGQQARELTREEQFFRAIRAGNVAAVQQFIDDGIDVDTRDSSGSPAIVLAAGYQQPEVVLLLIRAKADVNAKQRGRGSALHEAAHRGLTGAVRELIKAGADVNAEVFGQDPTPLHCAADINDVEIVKILIAAGAKVDSGSMTPLTRACRAAKGNKTAAIQALIDAKANLNPEDDSPLHWARSPAVIKLLIAAGADVNHRNKEQETPLHLSFAPHWGPKEDEVRLLIDAGGDVNARDKNNTTPLHNAVLNDYPKIVRMLIDAGADLDARDNFGNTPFSLAERIKSAEIDQLLKAAGADDGLTSLARAVRAGDPRQVQSLLATGVDVNEHGPEGKTALHLACDLDSIDVAYVLIAAEASLDARDAGNLTPLHWAKSRSMAQLLVDAGAEIHPRPVSELGNPLMFSLYPDRTGVVEVLLDRDTQSISSDLLSWAVFFGRVDAVQSILSRGKRPNGTLMGFGPSPLIISTTGAIADMACPDHVTPEIRLEVARLLIESGARVNATSSHGFFEKFTPLHAAAAKGEVGMIQLLLDHKAKVRVIGGGEYYEGFTPLHLAAKEGHASAVTLLLDAGADVNAVTGDTKRNTPQTPLDLTKSEEVRKVLIERGGKTRAELRK